MKVLRLLLFVFNILLFVFNILLFVFNNYSMPIPIGDAL